MKFLQKTWVAWLLTAVMIAAAVGIGQSKGGRREPEPLPSGSAALDESLSTEDYADYVLDEAGVLTSKQERQISLYNANWARRYDSIIAVAVKESIPGSIDDFAYTLGAEISLSGSDAILVIDASTRDAYLAASPDYPLTDSQISTYTNSALKPYIEDRKYGDGILSLFLELNQFYVDSYGLGYLDNGGSPVQGYGDEGRTLVGVVMLLFILIAIVTVVNAIDRMRYDTYRRRYYGVVNPPVMFRPIFFWHGPGTGWYRRNWRQPPPPPPRPPRGPGGPGPGGPGPGGFGGGFSGFSGPRGGGFSGGGSSRGGGFSGGRGGGFGGGGFSGRGPSRGGGFSGGRGGGFSGGGGSRGGGFGRR